MADVKEQLSVLKDAVVLYCEDSEEIRVNMASIFQNFFKEVLIGEDGQLGLELYKENKDRIDIIVSDIRMPNMNGTDMLAVIRETDDKMPVIFTTAFTEAEYLLEAIKLKATSYLTKPLNIKDALSQIAKIVNTSRQSAEIETNRVVIAKYKDTIDNYIMTTTTDANGVIVNVSNALCELSAYDKDELIGSDFAKMKHPDMEHSVFEDMWAQLKDGKRWEGEVLNKTKFGDDFWLELHIEPNFDLEDSTKIVGYTSVGINITDKKGIEDLNASLEQKVKDRTRELEIMATTDPMTNINNRRNFFTLGNKAFEKAMENRTEIIAVMFDIDKFKNVNDTYGHSIGDEVIKDMAAAVVKFIDEDDIFGRIGGEEFALLIENQSLEFVEEKSQKIRQYIQDLNPTYGDVSLSFTISTGITDIDYENDELDLMLARADEELYNAKNDGRNCVKSFRVKS